eukprot:4163111-Alexandrium_andersonii.AAC.1
MAASRDCHRSRVQANTGGGAHILEDLSEAPLVLAHSRGPVAASREPAAELGVQRRKRDWYSSYTCIHGTPKHTAAGADAKIPSGRFEG